MNILIIGGGGREHAIGWKIAQSPQTERLFFSPGNAGTTSGGANIVLNLEDHSAVIDFCKANNIGLVVIGPEDYLAKGLGDSLLASGIKTFGQTRAAAKLEWSKAYAKEFMLKHGVPTAKHKTFTNADEAVAYSNTSSLPVVIKADGLALGKGVVIAETHEDAAKTIHEMMANALHGEAGRTVVIEEYLNGREISTHAFCDGEVGMLFPSSQDHKRVGDGDIGPNTGGMGTVAPLPWVTNEMMERIQKEIVDPVLSAMKSEGILFKGILFPGIMITEEGPKVIEFNARFGDPEAQSYMRLLKSDLVQIMLACIEGNLKDVNVEWDKGAACCIALASGGYPGAYEKGIEITGLDTVTDEVVFHSGTKVVDGKIVTAGGRVLGVTAVGANLEEALKRAYKSIERITFKGMQFRQDIGQKSL